jgi:transcriptional regulator with XRE-family HTH domain
MPKRRGDEGDSELDDASRAYAKAVGQRLRMVRQQRQLTLEEVDANSNREFKDSALSAYERGDRIISVLRLQRLAAFYNVPVDYLLPAGSDEAEVIDLAALEDAGRPGSRERAILELVRETTRLRTVAEAMLEEVRKANEAAASRLQ